MTKQSRTTSQIETRERLLDAAQNAFSTRRVNDVSLDEIAASAGFTKGAVYANFASKTDLLFAVVERRMRNQGADYVDLLGTTEDSTLGAATGTRAGETQDTQLDYFRLVAALWGEAVHDPSIGERYAQLRHQHRTRLANAIEARATDAGITLPVDAYQLATGLIAMSMATMLDALIDPTINVADVHAVMADLVLTGVLAKSVSDQE